MNALMNALVSLSVAQVGGGDAASMQKAVESRSIFAYINAGGPLSYLLVCLSILAVALIIVNFVILRRTYLAPDHVIDGLEPLMRERNTEAVVKFCREPQNDSFLSRVIARGLLKIARSQYGMLELKPAIEEAGSRELDRLEKPNQGLAILAAVGPMLGLLGTVIGMIGAFAEIGSASGISKNEELARYMSLALVCTAEGLVVAIPCTFAYAMFKRRTDRLVAEVGDIAERLAGQFAGKHAAPKAAGGSGAAGRVPASGAA